MASGAEESRAVYCLARADILRRGAQKVLLPEGNLGAEVLINNTWGDPQEKGFFLVPGVICMLQSGPRLGSGSRTRGMVRLLGPVVLGAGWCPPEEHEHPWVPSDV